MQPRRVSKVVLVLVGLGLAAAPAAAQDWPSRPVTMIVPYAAGGPVDTVGRIMAQGLSEILGQQVLVENVGGAGGMTGANRVAKAGVRGQESGVRGQESGVRSQGSGVRGQESEVRGQESEVRKRRLKSQSSGHRLARVTSPVP